MHKMCGWLALVMAAGLFVTALTPMSALAHSGDRPIDLIDPIGDPGPVQYGDPDGSGSGRPAVWVNVLSLRIFLLASLHVDVQLPASQPLDNSKPALSSKDARLVGRASR